jgi:hypothetical protein
VCGLPRYLGRIFLGNAASRQHANSVQSRYRSTELNMANSPHVTRHHDHPGDHDHYDPDRHNWASPDYVANWAKDNI